MTILIPGADISGQADAHQKYPVVIRGQEIVQTSALAPQTKCLTGDKQLSNSVAVIEKPNNENLFDLSLLEEMDDNEYLSDILTIFLNNAPKELRELRKACSSNKFDAVCKMAHTLKGSTGLLRMNHLLIVLIRIEEMANAKKNDGLTKLAELANEEYKKIEVPLKKHLRNIQAGL